MRHFANPYPDYDGSNFTVDKEKFKSLIRHYVEQISKERNYEDGDLYVGSSGISYAFLKLHQLSETKSLIPDALRKAKLFIEHSRHFIKNKDADKASFLCGNAGIYAVSCIINLEENNSVAAKEDLKNFLSGFQVCQNINFCRYGSDEILFGRAGYLSAIYWLNQNLPQADKIAPDIITKICDVMIESGIQYSSNNRLSIPMMWECYGDKYLGAAHGICAILHMMLESPLFHGNAQNLNSKQQLIKNCIDTFLQMQSNDGNFPCVLEDAGKSEHKLVHWCHGGPGAVYLFAKAFIIFKEQKYLDSVIKTGELIWHKGLLRKGPGICHGVAGNGYVFLLLYRLTNDQKHLYRASAFANFLTNDAFLREARSPDRPLSLYEGIAGTICFLTDLLQPSTAAFPFMDVFDVKF